MPVFSSYFKKRHFYSSDRSDATHGVEPWLSVCRALSGSVGALSGLCRDSVGTLSVDNCRASVGLCRPLSTDPDRYYACTVSTSVGLSRLCQSVGLSVCRPLSVSVEASVVILSGPLS